MLDRNAGLEEPGFKGPSEGSSIEIFTLEPRGPFPYLRFSGRSERTAAPARHISESCITASSLSSFSR